jgi:hypothetical protein
MISDLSVEDQASLISTKYMRIQIKEEMDYLSACEFSFDMSNKTLLPTEKNIDIWDSAFVTIKKYEMDHILDAFMTNKEDIEEMLDFRFKCFVRYVINTLKPLPQHVRKKAFNSLVAGRDDKEEVKSAVFEVWSLKKRNSQHAK